MRRQVRSTNPLRMTLLGAAALAVLLLGLPAAGSYAAWNDSTPLGGTVTTGSLGIDQDAVSEGTWTRSGEAFDPASDKLTAGDMLTYAVADVPVTAVGDNLKATFSVSGAELPDAIKDHVDVDITSDPVPVQGSKSDADGHQDVALALTVTADDSLPSDEQTIDLSKLTVILTNGHGWSDTATLDAGTLTTGTTGPAGGKVNLTFDLQYDDDNTVGFYLQDPAPGTTIKWDAWDTAGKEIVTEAVDGLNQFEYPGSGTTTPWIEITGSFDGFGSPDQTDELIGSLTRVTGWTTDVGSTSASYAFKDAAHLIEVGGLPDTLTDTSYAFQKAGTAAVDNSNYNFGNWDSSHVTTMAHMFDGATSFNQSVESWDTSNVTDMSAMFQGAAAFNGNLNTNGDRWNTSKVTTMAHMFDGAKTFNGDIRGWNTGSVTTMKSMLRGAINFNGDITRWDTGSVTDMSSMFENASAFNGQLNNWATGTRAVTTMSRMFMNADSFNADLDLWNTQSVTDMSYMFAETENFKGDVRQWKVGAVTDMSHMFENSHFDYYSLGVSGDAHWDVSNVKDMSYMFAGSTYNKTLADWDVSNVATMAHMFDGATLFPGSHITTWDVSSVVDMSSMFRGTESLTAALAGSSSNWDVSNVKDMSYMFADSTFNQTLQNWDVSSVTNMEGMFQNATDFAKEVKWRTGTSTANVTNMSHMFDGATKFNGDLTAWNTGKVTTMDYMFRNASSFAGNLSKWNVSSVMSHTDFATGAGALTEPNWGGTPSTAKQAPSDAATQADDAHKADDQPAEPTSDATADTTSDTTDPETGTDTDTSEDAAAPEETPAPEAQVDPDQAVETLEDAWQNAQESDTDEARQALEDAAKVVDAVLGEGTADELVQQLEDEAAAAMASARPMATATEGQAD